MVFIVPGAIFTLLFLYWANTPDLGLPAAIRDSAIATTATIATVLGMASLFLCLVPGVIMLLLTFHRRWPV